MVFDLGGVLVDWEPARAVAAGVGEAEAHRVFAAADFDFFAWNHRQDAGRSFADGLAEVRTAHPEWVPHVEAYVEHFPDSLVGAYVDTVSVLREVVESGTPAYALTNWPAETFPHARTAFAFLADFTDVLVSGELGVAKPDPAVFAELERRTGVPAATTVFVDDNPVNVAAATAYGLDAVVFVGAEAFRADLVRRGVLQVSD